jgi:hypothetical protein
VVREIAAGADLPVGLRAVLAAPDVATEVDPPARAVLFALENETAKAAGPSPIVVRDLFDITWMSSGMGAFTPGKVDWRWLEKVEHISRLLTTR